MESSPSFWKRTTSKYPRKKRFNDEVHILNFYIVKIYHMNARVQKHMPAGAMYGLGLIGAAIYFIGTATSFGL